jgi:hypothetical protein
VTVEAQTGVLVRDVPERLVALVVSNLKDGRGIHAETAIAAVGTLAGEYVLRKHIGSFDGLVPGSSVSNDEVNQILFEDTSRLTISDIFMNALFGQGIDVGKSSWPETIPEENQVMMDPLEVVARLRPQVESLFEVAGLSDFLERAYAATSATAIMVAQARKVLDPNIGKALALEAMLRGAKTVPVG